MVCAFGSLKQASNFTSAFTQLNLSLSNLDNHDVNISIEHKTSHNMEGRIIYFRLGMANIDVHGIAFHASIMGTSFAAADRNSIKFVFAFIFKLKVWCYSRQSYYIMGLCVLFDIK